MTIEELANTFKDLTNGDLIRLEFQEDAKGAMEGRYMHVPTNKEGEQTYLHFTDGVRVFDLDLYLAQVLKSITVLEKWGKK